MSLNALFVTGDCILLRWLKLPVHMHSKYSCTWRNTSLPSHVVDHSGIKKTARKMLLGTKIVVALISGNEASFISSHFKKVLTA